MVKKSGKRTLKATPTTKVDGKLQPQALELEKAVLGALMIDNESLSDTIDSLRSEYFYRIEHQKIFEAITNLFNHTQPVDILTVTEELKRMGASIEINGSTALIEGVNELEGSEVFGKDLRSTAAIILASLAAKGKSKVGGMKHLDRGYEQFETKLNKVGAHISRAVTQLNTRNNLTSELATHNNLVIEEEAA